MFNFKLYENKKLYGMYYMFPNRGDGIPMHTHTEEQKHNIIVLSGSILVYGPNKEWCFELCSGDVFDLLDKHHPHEIVALEDNTTTLGMFINGRPDGEYLPEDEKSGTIIKSLTIQLED